MWCVSKTTYLESLRLQYAPQENQPQHFCQMLLKPVSLLEIRFHVNSLRSCLVPCSFLNVAAAWHGFAFLQYVKVCNCTGIYKNKQYWCRLRFSREFQQDIRSEKHWSDLNWNSCPQPTAFKSSGHTRKCLHLLLLHFSRVQVILILLCLLVKGSELPHSSCLGGSKDPGILFRSSDYTRLVLVLGFATLAAHGLTGQSRNTPVLVQHAAASWAQGKHPSPFAPVRGGPAVLELARHDAKCVCPYLQQAVEHSLASLVLLPSALWSPAPPYSSSSLSGVTANLSSAWASTASSWGDWQAAHQHQEPLVTPTTPFPGAGGMSAVQAKPGFVSPGKKGQGPGLAHWSYHERGRRFQPCFGTGKAQSEISAPQLCPCQEPEWKALCKSLLSSL